MFDFDKIRQGTIAMIASLILTATMVGAAVGPAHLVQAAPAATLQA